VTAFQIFIKILGFVVLQENSSWNIENRAVKIGFRSIKRGYKSRNSISSSS